MLIRRTVCASFPHLYELLPPVTSTSPGPESYKISQLSRVIVWVGPSFSHFTNIWSARVTAWCSFQVVGFSNQIEPFNSWLLFFICHCEDVLSFRIGLTSFPVCFIISPSWNGFSHFWLIFDCENEELLGVLFFSKKSYHLIATFLTCIFDLVGVGVIWRISSLFLIKLELHMTCFNSICFSFELHYLKTVFSCNFHLFCTGQVFSIFSRSTSYCPANWRKQFGEHCKSYSTCQTLRLWWN